MAMLDRINLIKCASDMKTKGILILNIHSGIYFLLCKPAFVWKTKLKLIAVFEFLYGAHDRSELWQLNLTDTCQLVEYLLLFCLYLLCIRQVLPFTTSTDAKMFATRLNAQWALFNESCYTCLAEGMFFTCDLQVDDVSRHSPWYKYHHIIYTCQRFPLSSYIGNGDILQYW